MGSGVAKKPCESSCDEQHEHMSKDEGEIRGSHMSQRNSFLNPMVEVRKYVDLPDSGKKRKGGAPSEDTSAFDRGDTQDASGDEYNTASAAEIKANDRVKKTEEMR